MECLPRMCTSFGSVLIICPGEYDVPGSRCVAKSGSTRFNCELASRAVLAGGVGVRPYLQVDRGGGLWCLLG